MSAEDEARKSCGLEFEGELSGPFLYRLIPLKYEEKGCRTYSTSQSQVLERIVSRAATKLGQSWGSPMSCPEVLAMEGGTPNSAARDWIAADLPQGISKMLIEETLGSV